MFLPSMPKDEYDQFVYVCDVGLVFLNHDCLAPNYPSRLLSYMQAGLPVLCATDTYTDIGKIDMDNGYGMWCESNCPVDFVKKTRELIDSKIRREMGTKSKEYFDKNCTVNNSYKIIVDKMKD